VRTLVVSPFPCPPAITSGIKPDHSSVLREIRDLHEMIARHRDFKIGSFMEMILLLKLAKATAAAATKRSDEKSTLSVRMI
jgi:hypothetical protein